MKRLAGLLIIFLGLTFSVYAQEEQHPHELPIDSFPIKIASEVECYPTPLLSKILSMKYGEKRVVQGSQTLKDNDNKQAYTGGMVMWISPEKLTYTIVATFDDSLSCIILAGKNFQPFIEDGINL